MLLSGCYYRLLMSRCMGGRQQIGNSSVQPGLDRTYLAEILVEELGPDLVKVEEFNYSAFGIENPSRPQAKSL